MTRRADLLVNFSFANDPTSHICELQLQHEMLLVIRKEGKAHESYGSFRSAYEILEAIGKAPSDVFDEDLSEEEMNPVDVLKYEVDKLRSTQGALEAQLKEKDKRINALEGHSSVQR